MDNLFPLQLQLFSRRERITDVSAHCRAEHNYKSMRRQIIVAEDDLRGTDKNGVLPAFTDRNDIAGLSWRGGVALSTMVLSDDSIRKAWIGDNLLPLTLFRFGGCRRFAFFHADARFHGADGGDGQYERFTFRAREQAVLTNQGVQVIDQRIQSGLSDFLVLAFVPCGGWGRSRLSCPRPEIVSRGFVSRATCPAEDNGLMSSLPRRRRPTPSPWPDAPPPPAPCSRPG